MTMMRILLTALIALATVPVAAQGTAPPAAVAPAPKPATVMVSLATSEGSILLEIETERAPITAKNFLRYVDSKRLDNAAF